MTLKAAGLFKMYVHNILIGVDQLLGTLLGGDPDETISSRVGKWATSGSKIGKVFETLLNAFFGKDHCKNCVEIDEGKEELKFKEWRMSIFDFFKKKGGETSIPSNPLHDAIFVARCLKFDSDPVTPGKSLMVGDSITAGAENFPDLFPGVINQGIPGDTTVDVRKRIHLVVKHHPSKIFLKIGTNNLGAWIATDTTCQKDYPVVTNKLILDYMEILNYFQAHLPTTVVYVQSILPINNVMPGTVTTGRTNLVIQQLNEVLSHTPILYPNVRYLNLYPKFLDSTGAVMDASYTDDGLHPNRKGYEVWSNILKEYL